MAQRDNLTLKAYFETGDKPTEGQFADLIDSFYNKLEGLGFATTTEEAINDVESHGTQNILASSSTFSGWRSEIGDIYTAFRYVEFGIYPFDGTLLPTQAVVKITSGQGGTVLAEQTINLGNVVEDQIEYITVDFGAVVSGLSGQMLALEVITNGRNGMVGGSNVPMGWTATASGQYATNANLNSPSWATTSGGVNAYKYWAKLYEETQITGVTFEDYAKTEMFTNLPPATLQELFNQHVSLNGLIEYDLGTSLGQTVGGGASWINENSMFSAWGTGVGVLAPFQTVRFKVRTWDAGNPVTQVRVRVRDTNNTGTILGDVLGAINTDANDYMVVDFGSLIDNGSNPIWFEFLTDGNAGMFGNSSDIHVAAQGAARYNTNKDVNAATITGLVTGTGGRIIEMEYFGVASSQLGFTPAAVADMESKLNITTAAPYINLPTTMYAVVGYKAQMFFTGIIEDINPYAYNIKVTGNVGGKQYPRYYEFTPTSTGTRTMTVSLYDKESNLIVAKTCTVEFVQATSQPASNTKVLCLGDSLTAGGAWTGEFLRMLTQSGGTPAGLNYGNIEFIGTVGSGGNLREAYGGKQWVWFTNPTTQPDVEFTVASHDKDGTDITSIWQDSSGNEWRLEDVTSSTILTFSRNGHSNNAPASGTLTHVSGANNTGTITYTSVENNSGTAINKFWNYTSNQLDIANYISSNGFGTVDVVYSLLSWNGFGGDRTEPADHATAINACKVWLDNLHAAFPSCKVKLMGIQLPSLDGGLAQNYGDATSPYGNAYSLVRSVFGLNKAYAEVAADPAYSSFVEFIEVASQFDAEYNMPHGLRAVNSRSATTEKAGTNGVHPSSDGYNQIADVAFRSFVAEYL